MHPRVAFTKLVDVSTKLDVRNTISMTYKLISPRHRVAANKLAAAWSGGELRFDDLFGDQT
jgi:hypothetical protein